MAAPAGLEPALSDVTGRCFSQLNYEAIKSRGKASRRPVCLRPSSLRTSHLCIIVHLNYNTDSPNSDPIESIPISEFTIIAKVSATLLAAP